MSLALVRDFFLWCTILNGGLLMFSFVMCITLGDTIGQIHSRVFGVPPETVRVVVYAFVLSYKIVVLTFNLIPWLALVIVG
jgi:hypothetical protein